MSVANAVSARNAASAPSVVAVTAAAVVAVNAVPAAKVVAANVVQSAAKAALNRAANAALKVVRKAAQSAPRVTPALKHAKAVAAVTVATVVQTATARHATLPRKNSHWPTRLPWPPLHAVTCRSLLPAAKSASHAKRANPASPVRHVAMAAANAVVAATSGATKHQPPRAAPPPLATSARPTCALRA
jgi:hypothetical protein